QLSCCLYSFLLLLFRWPTLKLKTKTSCRSTKSLVSPNSTAPLPLLMPRCSTLTTAATWRSSAHSLTKTSSFYHDKAGNTFGRPALVQAIKENICGKVTRELVAGTLQV